MADITYIRLRTEFVFLAVVIGRYSRKAIGWALDRSLTARVAVTALQQAIGQRQPPPGVVHRSDRGIQYASAEYAAVLKASQMVPSMSRPANPYWKSSLAPTTNRLRLHSALGSHTPEEFERDAASVLAVSGGTPMRP